MKQGMGQLLVEGRESERNLERAATMVRDAAHQGCDAIVPSAWAGLTVRPS